MVTTRPPKTIVKPTALGPVANTDTKLLIYGLFQKGRVLAQDGVADGAVWSHPVSARSGPARAECGDVPAAVEFGRVAAAVRCLQARPAADLSQPCAPAVGLSLATRSLGVGSQPCGAKYPRFCADSKGV